MTKTTLTEQIAVLANQQANTNALLEKFITALSGGNTAAVAPVAAAAAKGGELPALKWTADMTMARVPSRFKFSKVGERVKANGSGRVFVKLTPRVNGNQQVSVFVSKNDPTLEAGTYEGSFRWVEKNGSMIPAIIF